MQNLKQIAPANPEIRVSKIFLGGGVLISSHEGLIKAHLCTNFGWNPMKICRLN